TAATGTTVVLSSHLIGDLARVCDRLVVVRAGRPVLAGELDALLAGHPWGAGPRERASRLSRAAQGVNRPHHVRHSRLLVRSEQPPLDPELSVSPVDIEDLVLAYLDEPEPSSTTLIGSPG